MIRFKIFNKSKNKKYNFNINELKILIDNAFKLVCSTNKLVNFSIILVDKQEIQKLNKEYFHKDKPTDVLTLEYEQTLIEKELNEYYLGEIYINLEHPNLNIYTNSNIFYLLIVHGLLHLFGYDHNDTISTKKMFFLQRKILESLSN